MKNEKGSTGFHYACHKDNIEIVKLLVKYYPSIVEEKDNK